MFTNTAVLVSVLMNASFFLKLIRAYSAAATRGIIPSGFAN
jgi:hypothetical protein